MPFPPVFEVNTHQNNTEFLRFEFRAYGTVAPRDLTGADVTLEWEDTTGPRTPLVANPSDPGANWAIGIVVIAISPDDVTEKIGNYGFSLVLGLNQETKVVATGTINVQHRPGLNV